MSLETRHTEKQHLFNLLRAMQEDSELHKSIPLKKVVASMRAVMEAEDVAVVEKAVAEMVDASAS